MKVLLVNDFGSSLGGAEQYCLNLKAGLQQRGYELTTLSSDHQRNTLPILSDIQISQTGRYRNLDALWSPKNYRAFQRVLSDEAPDLVHFHNVFYALSPAVLYACAKTPSVITLHDYFAVCLGDKSLSAGVSCMLPLNACSHCSTACARVRFEKVRRWIARRALNRVDVKIAPSEYLQKEFQRNGVHGVETIPHAVPALLTETVQAETESGTERTAEGGQRLRTRLLYVGRLAEQKGVSILLDAVARVRTVLPELCLDICGDGPQREALEAQAQSLGLAAQVVFHGHTGRKELNERYQNAKAIVQSALWPEVSGLTVLEAARFGTPCIAADIGALPESVKHEENGLLFQSGDAESLAAAIARLYEDESGYAHMQAAARDFAKARSWTDHLDQIEALYQRLL